VVKGVVDRGEEEEEEEEEEYESTVVEVGLGGGPPLHRG